jgi:hypothetical protein
MHEESIVGDTLHFILLKLFNLYNSTDLETVVIALKEQQKVLL